MPGLSLTVQQLGAGGEAVGEPDTREARMAALHVPAGAAPTSFVPAGRFRATWEGNLNLKIRERYGFQAEGRGTLTVAVDDKPVFQASGDDLSNAKSEPVRLKKGANKLVVTYESPAQGDASVRLLWSRQGLPPGPPAPMVYTHDADAPATVRGRTLRAGRQLLAELRCTKCHAVPDVAAGGFPELGMDAPSFKDIGARLNRDWMAAWIADPQAVRRDARMPKVFHAGNRPAGESAAAADSRAADVAAYLATLGAGASDGAKPAPTPTPVEIDAGRRVYTALACVACHIPPDAGKPAAEPPRVPHAHVAAKFTPGGLKQYLLRPDAHYAWNPMPDFKLSDDEATKLAAYLLSAGNKKPEGLSDAPAGDAGRGAELVISAGCAACHDGIEKKGTPPAPALHDLRGRDVWARGCLAPDESAHRSAPVFPLTDAQRAAVVAFAGTDRSALARDGTGEFAERQYAELRCGHCHARDGAEPALVTTLAPEHGAAYAKMFGAGSPAEPGVQLAPDQQRFPPLTWAGEKLRPEWAASFIAGDVPYKPRPYLRARMPAFRARAGGIANGFAAQHGVAAQSDESPAPDASVVQTGQKLVGTVNGFSCVQCHAVAGRPALAPFEAPAIDFMHVTDRMREDYYHRWMDNPLAWDPATKMPRFSDDDGATPLRDTLGGDARKQYEAIWQYLLQGKDVRSPR